MNWLPESLTDEQWSGVVGFVFFAIAVAFVTVLSGGDSNVYVMVSLALTPGVGIVGGFLWWRLVERTGSIAYSRGALVGAGASLSVHLFLTVIMLPTGLLAVVLVPASWLLILLTGPVGVTVGVGLVGLRKRCPVQGQ